MSDPQHARTRTEAQRRADRIREFQAELAAAESDGAVALTPDARARLDAYHASLLAELSATYDVDVSDKQRQLSRGMQAVAIIGAVALGASVFLLFYRFWGRMGTGLQVALLAAAPTWAVAAADLASRRPALRFLTGLLALVAFAGFILNVEQLGEIFALTPAPEALAAYGLFAVAIAYAYGQRLLLATGAVCLALYGSACLVRLAGAWWLPGLFQRLDGFLLPGAVILAWSQWPHRVRDEFPPVLRGAGLIVLGLPMLVLTVDGSLSWLPVSSRGVETLYEFVTLIVAAGAIAVGMRRGWTEAIALGGALFTVALFLKYVDWFWDWMPYYLFFLIVGMTALILLWLAARVRARMRTG